MILEFFNPGDKELIHSLTKDVCFVFFWPNNHHLYTKPDGWSITKEIIHRHLRWLGHVLRTEKDRIPRVTLKWLPPGKRKPGRAKYTNAQNCDTSAGNVKLSWGKAQDAAKDRMQWTGLIKA